MRCTNLREERLLGQGHHLIAGHTLESKGDLYSVGILIFGRHRSLFGGHGLVFGRPVVCVCIRKNGRVS